MYAFPRRSVGTRKITFSLALFSPSRGERFISPCSHAPAWEQETVSVMYAFPRRSVGTRKLALLLPPLALLRAAPLPRLLPLKGGEICFSLFPCSRVGTRMVSVMYAFPRRSVGTRKITFSLPCCSPLWRCYGRPCRAISPSRGERFISPCSHAPAWEQETVSVMYAFPRRSVGTRKLALLLPPLALLRAAPLPRLLPLKGGEICFSLFPCSRVGTRMVSVMYAFPRRSVGTRN